MGRQMSFRARPQDLDRVLKRARQGAPADVRLVAVLEATGMAWYPVATYLEQQGVEVYRVNGQKTKDFRRFLWKHAGSDRIDSRVLAHLYTIAPDRLVRCPLPEGDLLALQRACRTYDRWRQLLTAEVNRMHDLDRWAWDGLHELLPAGALPWMRRFWYDPWRVQEAGEAYLAFAWREIRGDPAVDTAWVRTWVARAQEMTALFGSPQMVGYERLQATMRESLDLQAYYQQQQDRLKRDTLLPLYHALFPDCPLTTIKGIGEESAAIYRAFIQDIHRFSSVAEFRLWCGVVPNSRQSGDGEARGLSMTKAGPNLIKATLYLNANVARQWDVQIAAIYYRQMVDYGKHHSQALCACASHLANRIYAVLKENRPYQLRDLEGHPISPQQSRELCLQLTVPDEVRQRSTKRARRTRTDQKAEDPMQKP
ncbi:MAG: IS110 family transposase [Bacteroidetes bacterium]|nr:MAG: IS110 family transposase [Bacteroidota bacterium]